MCRSCVPSGVKVQIGEQLQVTGPKGSLTVPIPPGIRIEQKDGKLELLRDSDQHAALHGLTRALAANAVQGVSTGFTRELDIVGIGYRADVKGRVATFTLGYSHPIEVLLPEGVEMRVERPTRWRGVRSRICRRGWSLPGRDRQAARPGGGATSAICQQAGPV